MLRTLSAIALLSLTAGMAQAQTLDIPVQNLTASSKLGLNAQGIPLYDNTTATTITASGSNPNTHMLGVGAFANGINVASIDQITIAPVNLTTAPVSTTVRVRFWNNINLSTTAAAPINTGFLGGFSANFTNIASNTYVPTTFTLNTPILFPNQVFAVEFSFFQLGTTTYLPGASVTELIDQSGTSVGFSLGSYYRDVNADGQFAGSENRNVGANSDFYLRLSGTSVPEPGAVAMFAGSILGGASVLVRRRRK